MAYQTGTAADPADLLDKLRVFAAANGFTVNNFGDRTAGTAPRKALQLTKGTLAVSFLSDSILTPATSPGPFVGLYAHGPYVAGNGTENQLQASTKHYANDMGGPYQAYHFFSDNGGGANPYLYAVVETVAGTFKHFGCGILDSMGVLTTGVFTFVSRWMHETSPMRISDPESSYHSYPFDAYGTQETSPGSTCLRADGDTVSPRWYSTNAASGLRINAAGQRGSSDPSDSATQQKAWLFGPGRASASARTGRTTLMPCIMAVERPSSLISIVGAPPNIRHCRLTYLDPGQTITLGTDVWKVFPVIRKNGTTGQVNSGLYGLAYKVN